jgi:diketogulonate reductase-like aldo/keto reductase
MPAVNQFECHPAFSRRDLVDYCHAHDIAVTAHSSLGAPANGMHDHAALLVNESVTAIAASHGRTAAQVLLRWALQRGMAVIPKSVHPDRLAENAALFDFELTPDDMAVLGGLNQSRRYNHPTTPWLGRSRFPDD